MRKPNFENIQLILNREKAKRPTLFEFFLNDRLHRRFGGWEDENYQLVRLKAFAKLGYDYLTLHSGLFFPRPEKQKESSISLNEGAVIYDRTSFQNYPWPDPQKADYSIFETVSKSLPDGMMIIGHGPGGVLENVIALCGYDNLCFLLADDPSLVDEIFEAVGKRLVEHYKIMGTFNKVGAMISNDDWGFKTQPMLSPEHMRKYVFKWHRKIVEAIHSSGRPAILHSCGYLNDLMDEIISDLKYDAKHSYEDTICPVETAYEKLGNKIAILGGIDVDFLCRNSEEEIKKRCKKILEVTNSKAYALGSGNSIPEYVPDSKYLAMISTVVGGF